MSSKAMSLKGKIKNYAKINLKPNILKMDYLDALKCYKNQNMKFDICYIDPPYKANFGVLAIDKIIEYDLLNNDGLIIFEHLREDKFLFNNAVEVIDSKNYGTITVDYIKKRN